MRHISILAALTFFHIYACAQWVNCSETSVPGEVTAGPLIVVPVGTSTTGVSYSVIPAGDDTPTHEFAITRMNVMATDMLGMELLGADDDGIFNPEEFGIFEGETFCVTPVSYNLEQIRTLLDSIFFNDALCCQVLNLASEGFCDTLSNLGYTSGADVNDLNDVYRVMRLFDDDSTMSLEGFVFQISTVNNAGDILPSECGSAAFPFCYAIRFPFTQQCFSYGEASSVRTVEILSDIKVFKTMNTLRVDVNSSVWGNANITVTGMDGRMVHFSNVMLNQGINRFDLPMDASGLYNVSLSTGSERKTVRIASF